MRQHCTMLSVSREPENGISIACNRTILEQPSKDPNKRENNLFFPSNVVVEIRVNRLPGRTMFIFHRKATEFEIKTRKFLPLMIL